MKFNHLHLLAFLLLFVICAGQGAAQTAVIRPSVVTTFGSQVGLSLAQAVMRGEIRLVSDLFLSEVRTKNGNYQLTVSTSSRDIAVIPHSIGRRSRGVSVTQVTTAILDQLVRRRAAVRRK